MAEGKIAERIGRELKYAGSIVDLYEDTMRLPDGSIEHWDHVAHRKGAAAALPVMGDGRLILVRQYRNSIECETLEIPAGARENTSEPTDVCAAREMEEEIGYHAGKIEKLLHISTTGGFCNEQLDIYLATELEKTSRHLDKGEDIRVEFLDSDEACRMILDGEIIDAKTVSAILAYREKLREEGQS